MNIIEKIKTKQMDLNLNPPVTIAFFGDSVTQGCFELYKTGDESFLPEVRVEEGYHTKLRVILQMLYPLVPINMIYAGISGRSTEVGLKYVERDVCAFHPDLTIVCFGLNDCCAGFNGIDAYRENLKNIFLKLKNSGSEIIFLTPNLVPDDVSPEMTDKYTKQVYADIIRMSENSLGSYVENAKEICKEENIPVCDCYKMWMTLKENDVDTTRLLSNRINHPTDKMHWMFAFKLIETMFSDSMN